MFSGKYKIVMKTLMGKKHGDLALFENDHILTDYIDILGNRNEIQNGVLINGECQFQGKFITPIRIIEFTAVGVADDRSVSLNLNAGLLDMYISGEAATKVDNDAQ